MHSRSQLAKSSHHASPLNAGEAGRWAICSAAPEAATFFWDLLALADR
jgi:hypothetical protein